jgi:hypothetical protein
MTVELRQNSKLRLAHTRPPGVTLNARARSRAVAARAAGRQLRAIFIRTLIYLNACQAITADDASVDRR